MASGGGALKWKSVNTNGIYEFATAYIPTALLDQFGNPIVDRVVNYNGDQLVYANNDGSVARGVATSAPANASVTPDPNGNDIYDCYVANSPWEGAIKP